MVRYTNKSKIDLVCAFDSVNVDIVQFIRPFIGEQCIGELATDRSKQALAQTLGGAVVTFEPLEFGLRPNLNMFTLRTAE